jgi:hypothetical protein
MTTVAMRNVSPMMAGAASGVFNTTRQVGTVIGTAGVGALLQNRLLAGLTDQVQQRGAALPAAARGKLLAGFQSAAKGGLEMGSGRRASGLPGEIFTHGFVQAMRPTIAVPILFLIAAAVSCLLIKRQPAGQGGSARSPEFSEPSTTAAG